MEIFEKGLGEMLLGPFYRKISVGVGGLGRGCGALALHFHFRLW